MLVMEPRSITSVPSMPLPNFMIAGAPKCGTTALYRYLQTHPQVFLTEPKEPHYYAEDLGAHREVPRREDYLRLFDKAQPQHLAIGEASVWYMHSAHALERVKAEHPDIKLLILLRNPVEFVRSLHSDMVWICFEDQTDFEMAWALSSERRAGRRVPKLCQVPWFLDYQRCGQLGRHVERLLQVFPREQVKFILLDDLQQSPQRVYEETLAFLGLESDGRTDFPRFNASKQNRSPWLAACRAAVIRSLPRPLVEAGKKIGLGYVSNAVMQLNSRPATKSSLTDDFQHELLSHFRDDIGLLSELIDRDLDHWLQDSTEKQP
jgi:hypothetical protein